MKIEVGIITISDKCSKGLREDESGKAIKKNIEKIAKVVFYKIIPDNKKQIEKILKYLSDKMHVDVVLTTGGTGVAKRDVTPEATKKIIQKEIPGISELIRTQGYKFTPYSVISRAVAGIRKRTLIINLPGNPNAIKQSLKILLPIICHIVDILKGRIKEHKPC